MDLEEDSLLTKKHKLLRQRDHLLNMKLDLQREVLFPPPSCFGDKYVPESEDKLSAAEKLHHKFSDAHLLHQLECHMLCGIKVVNNDKTKLVVQFRPSYMQRILTDTYVVHFSVQNDGNYSVAKHHLPHSIKLRMLAQRWSPLNVHNVKNLLMDIKQQINAFHHRQNQVQQLKEWANKQNINVKIFHPMSLNIIIITLQLDDSMKFGYIGRFDIILKYTSSNYLPMSLDVENNEMRSEDLAAAKEQFAALKVYPLTEAFQICCVKTERQSLVNSETEVENANLRKQNDDNDSDCSSEPQEERNMSDERAYSLDSSNDEQKQKSPSSDKVLIKGKKSNLQHEKKNILGVHTSFVVDNIAKQKKLSYHSEVGKSNVKSQADTNIPRVRTRSMIRKVTGKNSTMHHRSMNKRKGADSTLTTSNQITRYILRNKKI